MTEGASQLLWTQPDWFAEVRDWIHAELERRQMQLHGLIEQQHVRPWSTVLRVPTSAGDLYFKATAPMLAHEPALTEALSRWRPDCILPVLATDTKRGWLLMTDGGVTLRSLIPSVDDLWRWHPVLRVYAEMQIEMVDRLPQLLAVGILNRRLALLPDLYAQLLSDTAALCIDRVDGLTSQDYQRLLELRPRVAQLCEQLARYGIPETLHHDDFHDANVLVRNKRFVFADWGESCVTHPFFTLLVMLRSAAYRLKLDDSAPELIRLRDIYLEPWTRYASCENVLAAFELAQRLAMICRALTWHHVVSQLEEPLKAEHAEAVPGWLQEFLNAETSAAS